MNKSSLFPRRARDTKAQAMVEFALVFPIVLLLMFGTIEFGRLFHAWTLVNNAAQEGARYASSGEWMQKYCHDLNGDGWACMKENSVPEYEEIDAARLPSIHEYVENLTRGLAKVSGASWTQPGFFQVTVCSNQPGFWYEYNGNAPPQCHPHEDAGSLLSTQDTRILVAVTYRHKFIMPFLNDIASNVVLHAEREGILERFRVERSIEVPPTIAGPTSTPTNTPTPTKTFTPTLTPTNTPTVMPTNTPAPSCDRIHITRIWVRYDDIRATVRNDNPVPIYLVDTHLMWTKVSSSQRVNYFRFGRRYYPGDDYSPPTDAQANPPISLKAGGSRLWIADFDGLDREGRDLLAVSDHSLTLTFDLGDGTLCPVTAVYSPPRIHVEIVVPQPGLVLTKPEDRTKTPFEAVAWDPRVGTNNGSGIRRVQFQLYAPDDSRLLYRSETKKRYCAFGGDSQCHTMYSGLWDYLMQHPGTYRLRARAQSRSDRLWSPWVEVTFEVRFPTATPTLTPTATLSPTPTPTPDCNLISIRDLRVSNGVLTAWVSNRNPVPIRLTYTRVWWPTLDADRSDVFLSWITLNQNYYSSQDYDSPTETDRGVTIGPSNDWWWWGAGWYDRSWHQVTPYGELGVRLTFDGRCTVEAHIVQPSPTPTFTPTVTPTPSRTPTPSNTPTPSRTPTPTKTFTPTPTPDCTLISMTTLYVDGDDVVAQVRNNNPVGIHLTSSRLTWDDLDAANGSAYVDWFNFNGSRYYTNNDYSSPTTASGWVWQSAGSTATWRADFDGTSSVYGRITLQLTFDNRCTVSRTITINTPTPTPSRTPSPTPSPTPTIDCSKISLQSIYASGNRLYVQVGNRNPVEYDLTYTHLQWYEANSSEYVDEFRFNGNRYYSGNDYSSPTSSGNHAPFLPNTTNTWYATFGNVSALYGSYTVQLTFEGVCTITGYLVVDTPTPTFTPPATATPTRTPTPTPVVNTPTPTLDWGGGGGG